MFLLSGNKHGRRPTLEQGDIWYYNLTFGTVEGLRGNRFAHKAYKDVGYYGLSHLFLPEDTHAPAAKSYQQKRLGKNKVKNMIEYLVELVEKQLQKP